MWVAISSYKQARLSSLIRKLMSSMLAALGVFWLTLESTSFFLPAVQNAARPYWWLFLMCGFLYGLFLAKPRTRLTSTVGGSDVHITIVVKDIFDLPGQLVLGTNTCFDTSLENDVVNKNSLQGQFTAKHFHPIKILDDQIVESLEGVEFEEIPLAEKPYGKRKHYRIGTVARVSARKTFAYFLATSKLNESKVAKTTLEDIRYALVELWGFLRERGSYGTMLVPVLGTGFSRLNQPRDLVIKEIVKSFVVSCREGKCCEHLTIAIRPEDFTSGNINLDRLEQYLEYACTYIPEEPQGTGLPPAGTSLGM